MRRVSEHQIVGLFAGIGGFERGLGLAGMRCALLCDADPAARAVLSRRFPGVRLHDDVRELDALPRGATIVTAGFPCQDLSQVGGRKGINGRSSGLVANVFRLLEKRPVDWVILENVPFMLYLKGGRAMSAILGRLEGLGYRWAYRVVDSRAFGLPQRRERVFVLASRHSDPRAVLLTGDRTPTERLANGHTAYGFYWTEGNKGIGWTVDGTPPLKGGSKVGIPSAPAIVLPRGRIVVPDIRDAERLQGFPSNWTKPAEGVRSRGARWRLVGNAVSVPVARWIGEQLLEPRVYDDSRDEPISKRGTWPRAAWSMGHGRHGSSASSWPARRTAPPLAEFLHHSRSPLSAGAAQGFLDRLLSSNLSAEDFFIDALEAHISRMRKTS